MKLVLLLLASLASPVASIAQTVILQFDVECDVKSQAQSCKQSTKTAEVELRDGKWYGIKDEITDNAVELQVLRDDKYILILSNPVAFSGSSILHIAKPTGKFYWTEIAYSEILKEDENHIRIGTARKK